MGGNAKNISEGTFAKKVEDEHLVSVDKKSIQNLHVLLNGAFGNIENGYANNAVNKAGVNGQIGVLRQIINDKIIYEDDKTFVSRANHETLEASVEALEKTRFALDEAFVPENVKTEKDLLRQVRAELNVSHAIVALRGIVYFGEVKQPLLFI